MKVLQDASRRSQPANMFRIARTNILTHKQQIQQYSDYELVLLACAIGNDALRNEEERPGINEGKVTSCWAHTSHTHLVL
jgi:hypothetical protein